MKNKIIDLEKENIKLKDSLRRVLEVFTNLHRIPDSEEIYEVIKEARSLLGETSKKFDIRDKYNISCWFDISVNCSRIEKIKPYSSSGNCMMSLKLKEVEVSQILAELYELFGEDLMIDFIKNG